MSFLPQGQKESIVFTGFGQCEITRRVLNLLTYLNHRGKLIADDVRAVSFAAILNGECDHQTDLRTKLASK